MRFSKKTKVYEQYAVVQKELVKHFRELIDSSFLPQEILELGAGTGLWTQVLRETYPQAKIYASDQSTEMVAHGKSSLPSAEWKQLDAWAFSHPPVELICSASLLQWLPSPETALPNWRKALAPGGRMLHGFYIQPTLQELYSLLDGDTIAFRPIEYWKDLFNKNGFVVRNYKNLQYIQTYKNAFSFLQSLHHTGTVPKTKLSYTKMKELIRKYDKAFHCKDGVYATWGMAFFEVERNESLI